MPDELLDAEIQSGKSIPTTPTGIRKRKMSTAPQYHRKQTADNSQHNFFRRRISRVSGTININDVLGRSISVMSEQKGGRKSVEKNYSSTQNTEPIWHSNEAFRESEELKTDEQP